MHYYFHRDRNFSKSGGRFTFWLYLETISLHKPPKCFGSSETLQFLVLHFSNGIGCMYVWWSEKDEIWLHSFISSTWNFVSYLIFLCFTFPVWRQIFVKIMEHLKLTKKIRQKLDPFSHGKKIRIKINAPHPEKV